MIKIDLRDPRKQRLILLSLGMLAAGYYFFFSEVVSFTYRARGRELTQLREERDQLSQALARARGGADRLDSTDQEREALAQRWLELEAVLPAQFDSPAFLSEVTSLGHRENLEFLLFEPKGIRSHEYYQEAPVEVRAEGGYHEVGRFLADLENMPQLVRISTLKMKTNPRAKGQEQDTQDYVPPVVAEMEISTCFLGDGPAAAAPAEETKGKRTPASAEPKASGPRATKPVARASKDRAEPRGEGEP